MSFRFAYPAAASLALCAVALSAQQPAPAAPQSAAVQTPENTFRAGVDVIELDVSVLDKDRLPIRGLTAADFTVLEDGKPQRIVAVSEVDAAEKDPMLSPWMRHTARDVAVNDLATELGDGRLFAIVIDDFVIPGDAFSTIMSAREIAHSVVDGLGPSDLAAVVYTGDAGDTQDFTDDHAKLGAAIDRYSTHPPRYLEPLPVVPGPVVGDAMTSSPILGRFRCFRTVPAIPTLDAVAQRFASVPQRRKTVIYISPGNAVPMTNGPDCIGVRYQAMLDLFRHAQRGNVNIYSIDPTGTGGIDTRFSGLAGNPLHAPGARMGSNSEFLKITSENTGAEAATSTDDFDAVVDQIFAEDGSYYLVGYQTSNGAPDGRYRRIQVKVNRKGATARSRSGRWAPREDSAFAQAKDDAPTDNELHLSGLMSPQGLLMRASAVPLGLAASSSASHDADVGLVLSVQVPAPLRPLADTITIIRNVYDADGNPGPPVKETADLQLLPSNDPLQFDLFSRIVLSPGRYQIRFNGASQAIGKSGSVYADLEVPDFAQAPVTLSGIVLGTGPRDGVMRAEALASLVPIVPTNAREFAPGDHVTAYVRAFQGGAAPASVSLDARVVDLHDAPVFTAQETLAADAFTGAGAGYRLELPTARLTRGPYLLSITATANARSVRRDVVFRIR